LKPEPYIQDLLNKPAIQAAPLLLGCEIVRQTPEGELRLKIVETEAYHQADPASHSFRGKTSRTSPMFKTGGRLYVYFIYGVHYCLNIVTGPEGVGEAVLLRAAEPIKGIDIMAKNRGVKDIHKLASGPGKLAQALGIKDTKLSGQILNKSSIWLELPQVPIKPDQITASARVGITKAADAEMRFLLKNNQFVSRV
jgi:DNA-3-methyladenine glycosylase